MNRDASAESATLAAIDSVMCEADDLYFAMNEASVLGNIPLVDHYDKALGETMRVYHALCARLEATVN